MNARKIEWVPSILIMGGGLYTVIYLSWMIKKTYDMHEQATGFMKGLSAIAVVTSGSLIIPIIIGGIVVLLGLITVWKRRLSLAVVSFVLAFLMMNWIGSALSVFGSVMAFIVWEERSISDT